MWKLILSLNLAGSLLAAGSASGKLIVNGKTRELKAVRAVKVVEDSEELVRVFVSDVPVPASALFREMDLFALDREGEVHGVLIDFRPSGVVLRLRTKDYEGSFSRSQSPNPFAVKVAGSRVSGEVSDKQAADSSSGLTYDIAMKFSADIETKAPELPPAPADAKAAAINPAAITYLDFMDALAKGDRARIRTHAPAEARAQIDSPDFVEMLKMMQAMQEREIRVVKAQTTENETKLWVTGKSAEGKPRKGEVIMKLQDARWIMRSESWRD